MKVIVAKGTLPSRDTELKDLPRDFWHERDISVYLRSARTKTSKQEGEYRSTQGATITPIPCWAIEIETTQRKTPKGFQSLPLTEGSLYFGVTARWAGEVTGTGSEKEKWRGIRQRGKISLSHCFSVVSSSWLVPFSIAHRYIVHIPAEPTGSHGREPLRVRHDMANLGKTSLAGFGDDRESIEEAAIRSWTQQSQRAWSKQNTDRSTDLVTQWLDYRGKISIQNPSSYRVVHTRSRSFYAAVVNPQGRTASGLPYNAARVIVTEANRVVSSIDIPIAGVIADNLLHYVNVESKQEAYWMSGIFNSTPFEKLVMKEARGEPPGIYTIPQKVLARLGLVFDSEDDTHLKIAQLAAALEKKMNGTLRKYLSEEKGLNLELVDDTDRGPDIPPTISSALMRRLGAETELRELDNLVLSLISVSKQSTKKQPRIKVFD